MMILTLGTSSLIFMQACRPERLGMRTSRSTTSGTVATIRSVALIPSPASPTTSMPGSTPSSMVRPRRKSSWSSTTSTRIGSRPVSVVSWATGESWHVCAPMRSHVGDDTQRRDGPSGPSRRYLRVPEASDGRLEIERDHAVVVSATPVDDGGTLALLVHEQVEVVADQLHLVERLVERHRVGRVGLLAYDEGSVA